MQKSPAVPMDEEVSVDQKLLSTVGVDSGGLHSQVANAVVTPPKVAKDTTVYITPYGVPRAANVVDQRLYAPLRKFRARCLSVARGVIFPASKSMSWDWKLSCDFLALSFSAALKC